MKKLMPYGVAFLGASMLIACAPAPQSSDTNTNMVTQSEKPTPPIAKKIPHELVSNGNKRIDDYYWLRDDSRKNPEMLAYLEANNQYAEAIMAPTKPLQKTLFDELKARIKKDDNTIPVKTGEYFYSTEMRGNNEYPIYVRSKTFDGAKETILDVNKLATGHPYFYVSQISVSPNGKLLAYGADSVSRRLYTLTFIDLATGKTLEDKIENTKGEIVWANDNQTVYYIKKNVTTLLGYQVYRHKLGTQQSQDELVYEEHDLSYYTYLTKSKDKSEIYISHVAPEATDMLLIDANNPKAKAEFLTPREPQLMYSAQKLGNTYYILTNLDAKNGRIMKVGEDKLGDKANWQDVIAGSEDVQIESFDLFNNYLVYQTRANAQQHVMVMDLNNGATREVPFNGDAYSIKLYGNNELDNAAIRLQYSSLTTPTIDYDVNLKTLVLSKLKQETVLGYDESQYESKRIFITARDGIKVPVTLVYNKTKYRKDGSAPMYQYGYGSYGFTIEPSFDANIISLLDRGVIYARAHIRGSQMMGRQWYENGKKLHKKNTFNDFIDTTKALVEQGYAAKDKVFASGASAGGLLMGAVINQAPELYLGVKAGVPFVDIVTTMLDDSIPLTTNEYDEWGNPNQQEYYDYMLSYSPYDQVKHQDYPNLLVTSGLFDSQVQYFEPAKWVAKLRDYKTDHNLLIFKTDMTAGHGGASGRFKPLHDTAYEYAFFLDLLHKQQAKTSM